MDRLTWVLNRLVRHDVALRNAAVASIRMGHRRREREDVEAFLGNLARTDENLSRLERTASHKPH